MGKKQKAEGWECLPASVLVVYLGEENKPVYPLLIRTDMKDSSYLKFVGGGKEKFDKYGFDVSRNYLRMSAIDKQHYDLMKNYILSHNTGKDRNFHNSNQNTMKIILSDKCDFLMYSVDEAQKGFFSRLIDTLNLEEEDKLRKYLNYYQEIQNWK